MKETMEGIELASLISKGLSEGSIQYLKNKLQLVKISKIELLILIEEYAEELGDACLQIDGENPIYYFIPKRDMRGYGIRVFNKEEIHGLDYNTLFNCYIEMKNRFENI